MTPSTLRRNSRQETEQSASCDSRAERTGEGAFGRKYKSCRRCRRWKMKCELPGDGSCKRCEQAKVECVFDVIGKRGQRPELELEQNVKRIKSLEAKINQLNGTVQDLRSERTNEVAYEATRTPSQRGRAERTPASSESPNAVLDDGVAFASSVSTSGLQATRYSGRNEPPESAPSPVVPASHDKRLENITSSDLHAPLRSINEMVDMQASNEKNKPVPAGHNRNTPHDAGRHSGASPAPSRQQMFGSSENPRLAEVLASQKATFVVEDPVTRHGVDEDKARALFNLFFAGSLHISAMFDPVYDTFDSLRARSTFCLSAILAVADQIESGTSAVLSKSERVCQKVARELAARTLFEDAVRLEDVQGMIIMAAYCERCWYLIGHAVRMAVALHLDQAVPRLLEDLKRQEGNRARFSESNELIRQARTWMVLAHAEREIASGTARKSLIDSDDPGELRQLLQHPHSTSSDVRVIANLELVILREHFQNKINSTELNHERAIPDIQAAAEVFEEWLEFWEEIYRYKGYHADSFHRCSLKMQRIYAEIITCCATLGKFETKEGVPVPSEHRSAQWNEIIQRTYSLCAEEQLPLFLENKAYKWHFKFGPTYAAMMIAFATVLALKISRYHPQTKDIHSLVLCARHITEILNDYSFADYARVIKLVVRLLQNPRLVSGAESEPLQTRGQEAPTNPNLETLQQTWSTGEEDQVAFHTVPLGTGSSYSGFFNDAWADEPIEQLLLQNEDASLSRQTSSVLFAPGWMFDQANVDSLGLPKEGHNSIFTFDMPIMPNSEA